MTVHLSFVNTGPFEAGFGAFFGVYTLALILVRSVFREGRSSTCFLVSLLENLNTTIFGS